MSQRKWKRRDKEFKKLAVERMGTCGNIGELSAELGVARRSLYNWQAEQRAGAEPPITEQNLRRENERLKKSLAERVLEVDFFEGALRRIEEGRRQSKGSGEMPSTSKSGR